MRMNPQALIAAVLIALPSFADGQALEVAGLRSRLQGEEAKLVDAEALSEQVRDVARRTLPDLRVLATPESGGDLTVSGDLLRIEQGYLVTLELREVHSGRLGGTASGRASTPEELVEAVASAAVDLFRSWKAASELAIAPAPIPEVPAASPTLPQARVASLDVDAAVLVAYDEARSAEARGKDHPEDAAASWRAVAESPGQNPFRDAAASRAKQWQAYADGKRRFEAHLKKDTALMRKVLPIDSVTEATKLELMVRYARAYGAEKATALIALLPAAVRPRAALSVGCETKNAASCVSLARAADEAQDSALALEYLDRACATGDVESCAEAGDRWLRPETRDVAQAFTALQRGCAGGGAAACARLARVYEEGDGTDVNLAAATETRDEACTAGDGKSCRKLACTADSAALAADLWRKGCKDGDALSCTLAEASAHSAGATSVARRQVEEAVGARPASMTLAEPAHPDHPASAPAAVVAPAPQRHRAAGAALVGIAALAGTGALVLAMQDDGDRGHRRWGWRELVEGRDRHDPSRALALGLGAAAAVSAAVGVGLFFWRSDPSPASVQVGVAPTGLVISGVLP